MVPEFPIGWLLDSDPSLRWQVERDLVGAPPSVWEATRSRIATEGFGARLLALQDPDGQWAGGAYFPAGHEFSEESAGSQPYTATTWSLNTLRDFGMDSTVLRERRTAELLDANSRWEYEDLHYWGGEVDCSSTLSRSPTGCGSGPMWQASLRGSSNTGFPTVGGTANG